MFIIVLNFIRQHVVAVAEIMLVMVLCFQHVEVRRAETKLATCREYNEALVDANKHLSALADMQNAAISHVQMEAEKKAHAAAAALARAKEHATRYAEEVQHIRSFKSIGDDCADMRVLLDDYFGRMP